jgi:MinD-like ATPase involved in chromosome partitioning or flagellar assembly
VIALFMVTIAVNSGGATKEARRMAPAHGRATVPAAPPPEPPAPNWVKLLVTAAHPWITPKVRTERQQRTALAASFGRAASIAVVSAAPRSGGTTLAALLARVFAAFQDRRVLAIDTHPRGGLAARLGAWPPAPAQHVLTGLGLRRDASSAVPPGGASRRWLQSRLATPDGLLILTADPNAAGADIRAEEYRGFAQTVKRWRPLLVTDAYTWDAALLSAVIGGADRVVLAATADAAGLDWVRRALPWIGSQLDGEPTDRVVAAFTQVNAAMRSDNGVGKKAVAALPVRAVTIPHDSTLARPEPLDWTRLAVPLRRSVLRLAANLAQDIAIPALPGGVD